MAKFLNSACFSIKYTADDKAKNSAGIMGVLGGFPGSFPGYVTPSNQAQNTGIQNGNSTKLKIVFHHRACNITSKDYFQKAKIANGKPTSTMSLLFLKNLSTSQNKEMSWNKINI